MTLIYLFFSGEFLKQILSRLIKVLNFILLLIHLSCPITTSFFFFFGVGGDCCGKQIPLECTNWCDLPMKTASI